MERGATTFIRFVPRGRTNFLPVTLTNEESRALAQEMQQAQKTHTGLLDDNSFSDTASMDMLNSSASLSNDTNDEDLEDVKKRKKRLKFPGHQFFGTLEEHMPFLLENDAYIQPDAKDDSEDEAEKDAERLRDTDYVLLAACADETIPSIEVFVYDEDQAALYVHHDFLLPHPALAIEWLDVYGKEKGNYCAVGYYGSYQLDLWDINDPNQPESLYTFEASDETPVSSKKRTSLQIDSSAFPSILCLHKNHHITGLVAAGTSQHTLKLWDLVQLSCTATYRYHTDKVQEVKWHPVDAPIVLTASYDKTLHIKDVRDPTSSIQCGLTSDPESAFWNRAETFHFWIATDDGRLTAYDIRSFSNDASSPYLAQVQAHSQSCSGITDSPVPGMLVSCGLDGLAKLWNISDATRPTLVFERNLKAGPLYSISAANETPTLFSFGGSVPVIWDVTDTQLVNLTFNLPSLESSS